MGKDHTIKEKDKNYRPGRTRRQGLEESRRAKATYKDYVAGFGDQENKGQSHGTRK